MGASEKVSWRRFSNPSNPIGDGGGGSPLVVPYKTAMADRFALRSTTYSNNSYARDLCLFLKLQK